MHDAAALVIAIILFCVAEGFTICHPRAILIRRTARGKWRISHPATYPGNGSWAWFWVPPAPFLQDIAVLEPPLLRPLSTGIVFPAGRGLAYSAYKPWDELAQPRVLDGRLRAGDLFSAKPYAVETAHAARVWLARAFSQSPQGRAAAAEDALRDSFNVGRVCERTTARWHRARWLRRLSGTQASLLLFAVPSAVVFLRFEWSLAILLPLAFAVNVLATWACWRMRSRDHSTDGTVHRALLFQYLVFPPRVCFAGFDAFADAFAGMEPVAVLNALAHHFPRTAAIREAWVEAQYPEWESEDLAAPVEAWEKHLAGYEAALRDLCAPSLRPDVPLSKPMRLPADARSYCPRCGMAYRMMRNYCGDCPGVELVPVPPGLAEEDSG